MDRAQRLLGRGALVLGSILVTDSVCFALVASVQIASDSCDLGLTIRFVKTLE